jgi:hypothetical protein
MQPTAMTSSNPQISDPMMAAVMMDSCGVNKHYNGSLQTHGILKDYFSPINNYSKTWL